MQHINNAEISKQDRLAAPKSKSLLRHCIKDLVEIKPNWAASWQNQQNGMCA